MFTFDNLRKKFRFLGFLEFSKFQFQFVYDVKKTLPDTTFRNKNRCLFGAFRHKLIYIAVTNFTHLETDALLRIHNKQSVVSCVIFVHQIFNVIFAPFLIALTISAICQFIRTNIAYRFFGKFLFCAYIAA